MQVSARLDLIAIVCSSTKEIIIDLISFFVDASKQYIAHIPVRIYKLFLI